MKTTLESADGTVIVEELKDGKRKLVASLKNSESYLPYSEVVTSYPLDLIEFMLEKNGAIGICYEIMRDEDPYCVERLLRNDIFGYFNESDFADKKVLEFGCGTGASTVILARMFPTAKITGVELFENALAVAEKRVAHHKLSGVELLLSPSGTELPTELNKQFDFIMMSAVYEHILPEERAIIMSKLWSLLRENGFLFINQTPNLLFPFELHTTSLPLINYLPDSLTQKIVRRFSKRVPKDDSWETLLRKGIRGATVSEIMKNLPAEMGKPVLLEPTNDGLKDRIDLFYKNTNQKRLKTVKQIAKVGLKAIYKISGAAIIPDLSLAIKKESI